MSKEPEFAAVQKADGTFCVYDVERYLTDWVSSDVTVDLAEAR